LRQHYGWGLVKIEAVMLLLGVTPEQFAKMVAETDISFRCFTNLSYINSITDNIFKKIKTSRLARVFLFLNFCELSVYGGGFFGFLS
jgi:hypothetical protein